MKLALVILTFYFEGPVVFALACSQKAVRTTLFETKFATQDFACKELVKDSFPSKLETIFSNSSTVVITSISTS